MTSGLGRMTGLALALGLWVAAGCGDDGYGESLVDRFDYGEQVGWGEEGVVQLALSDSCGEARESLRDTAIVGMLMDLERNRRAAIDDYRDRDSFFDAMFSGGFGGSSTSDMAGSATLGMPNAQGGRSFTDTNVQTEGVDEADVVETDGDLLYTLSGNDLVIVDAWPAADMAELGRVNLPGDPTSMYLYDDRVLVLSQHAPVYGWSTGPTPAMAYGMTIATLVNVAEPTSPIVMERWGFDGQTNATRRVGGKVYLVQATPIDVDGMTQWVDTSSADDVDEITARYVAAARNNIAQLEGAELDGYLPQRYDVNAAGAPQAGTAEIVTDCGEVYRPEAYSGRGVVSVVTVDLDAPEQRPYAASIVGGWGTVYASGSALYVATSDWAFNWWWGNSSGRHYTTQIHKFDFEPTTGEAIYAASGSVPGHTFDQFALDERNGQLRVATTGMGGAERASFVTVLEANQGELTQVGQVGGIGPGEDIYAVRFIEDQGYVVTFFRIDPLHVIDLSDPTNPRIAGELEIPGYSSYLHPMGDGYLLAIGRDGNEWGGIEGLQLSIFDVTDPTDPRRVHKITHTDSWGSYSEAESDHHAFNYYAERGLLAIPVGSWDRYGESVGLSLFRVDPESGFEPLGTITHDDLAPSAADCVGQAATIRRGVFIEDVIYSVSPVGVKAHATDELGEALSTVGLFREGGDYCDDTYYGGRGW